MIWASSVACCGLRPFLGLLHFSTWPPACRKQLRIAALPRFATLQSRQTKVLRRLRIAALPRFATLDSGKCLTTGTLRIAALPRFATLEITPTPIDSQLRIAALPRFATLWERWEPFISRLRIAALPRFATLDGGKIPPEHCAADCGPSSVCYTTDPQKPLSDTDFTYFKLRKTPTERVKPVPLGVFFPNRSQYGQTACP